MPGPTSDFAYCKPPGNVLIMPLIGVYRKSQRSPICRVIRKSYVVRLGASLTLILISSVYFWKLIHKVTPVISAAEVIGYVPDYHRYHNASDVVCSCRVTQSVRNTPVAVI